MVLRKQLRDIPTEELLQAAALTNPTPEAVAAIRHTEVDTIAQAISAILQGDKTAYEHYLAQYLNTGADSVADNETGPEVADGVHDQSAVLQQELPQPDHSSVKSVESESIDTEIVEATQTAPALDGLAAKLQAAAERKKARHRVVNPADFILGISRDEFVPYQWGASDSVAPGIQVEIERSDDQTAPGDVDKHRAVHALIHWNPIPIPPGHSLVYLVIGADSEQPLSPESGTQLVLTQGTAYRDEIAAGSGMRHYMVWAYSAPTVDGLLEVQPIFVGEQGIAIAPHDITIVESNGIVNGTWTPLRGHSSMAVFMRQAYADNPIDFPAHQLRDGVDSRSFVCSVPVRGGTYEFQIFPEIVFRGKTIRGDGSAVFTRRISADIQAVELLSAVYVPKDDNDRIALEWVAPPTGEVKIYLTNSEPAPDLINQAVDSRYLADDDALGATEWINTTESEPGETVFIELMWPSDWPQVYCVPVNVVGDQSLVGEFKVLHRVGEIHEPTLIQRVDSQLITFDWPFGADLVEVTQKQGESVELTAANYHRQGGIRLHLNSFGDEVTLTPKSIYAGQTTKAKPAIITYAGLKIYRYVIDHKNPYIVGDLRYPRLWLWRDGVEDRQPPRFILVHNPLRLPLFPGDGTPVKCAASTESGYSEPGSLLVPDTLMGSVTAAEESARHWVIDCRSFSGGFLRLFIQDDGREEDVLGERIVVDDDAVSGLCL